ncbi:MAG: VOC family protein [Anaerolineae bacterium]|nr:VOC family protein [Anaerolineae bacterium]
MVKDVGVSRQFYEGVLGQEVDLDFGPNVSFAGGLFSIWQVDHAHEIMFGNPLSEVGQGEMELYFETDDLDEVMQRLADAQVEFVHPLREQPWGQRVVRAYDPDGHIVEAGEPMPVFVARFLNQGMSVEQAAERTGIPVEIVRQIAANVGGDPRGQDGPGGSRDAGMTENMEEK